MTFHIYEKEIQISDKLCNAYATYTGMPLTDANLSRLADIYADAAQLSSSEIDIKELRLGVIEMMYQEICANTGEELEKVADFLKQKGYI